MSIEVYRVISAALGAGVYNCNKQQLLATGWEEGSGDKFEDILAGEPPAPVTVEVLNLLESNSPAGSTRMLVVNDKIAAWNWTDCAGGTFKMGMPLVSSVRMFQTTEDAGGAKQLTCNMVPDGETAVESGLGSGIEVYFKPTGDANLDSASPRFEEDDYLFAEWIGGQFYFIDVPQKNRDCAPPPE